MNESIIVIDTETTGLDTTKCKIIEIGAVVVREGRIIASFSSLVKNDLAGAEMALRVNGIDPDDVAIAPSPEAVAKMFLDFMAMFAPFKVTAFNIPFDRGMLESNWAFFVGNGAWAEDVKTMAARLLKRPAKAGPHWPRLMVAAKMLGVDPGTHRALDDAMAAAEVMIELMEREANK